ncbi:Gfo/Idh/MocA family oxidoreductase [Anaerocolumna sedimenticola]|uniref:Gfo/Idh/MocA family oxidoreductase n=1 Tax=Anaerocolumna sedimenticola TaxID=2696063 RepID=A0A6P1TTS4_9FIRM|nr:Gfo/Idh/MocA family oxidoreductase [Anaerocolumna sedimenticola]QHQ62898.1 Gfo/Idh/MocA family oxidoreductase [Anaerocolumna sedimenticola]
MDKVKVGIIGIGNMGSGHCNTLLSNQVPEMELIAVADLKESRRNWAKENLPESVMIFENGDVLIEAKVCDAVIVATPHYDHPRLVMKTLEYGQHALSEKPAGVYTKQVRQMNEAAAKSNLVFAMMFNQRTNHVYRKMYELVHGGTLGAIKRVNWIITDWYRTQAYYNSGEWRATWEGEGGGVLLNQCPHNLDLLQWICGMPNKVQAFCHNGKWHDIEVEDDVTAYLEYPGGATGVFVTTTGDAPGTNRFEITLEKGKLVCEEDKLTLFELETSEREYCYSATEGFKKPEGHDVILETDGKNPQHVGVLNAFAGKILHGTPLVAEGTEGINGLTLSNAMHLSSWINKPVELPFDEELFLTELNKRRADSKLKKNVKETVYNTESSYGSEKK